VREFETQFVTAGSLLYSVEHRPWMPPDGQWLLSQSWNDVLFAHYAMEPSTLRAVVPQELTLELYGGAAWLTISPFSVSHVRPSGVPPLPGISFFPQLNVRTYVTLDGKPGVYYLSVDAASLGAVWFARLFFRMQYWHASIQVSGDTIHARKPSGAGIQFLARRLHGPGERKQTEIFDATYVPEGEPDTPKPGSLDHFLTERYCTYSLYRKQCYRTEIHHQPWPLQKATVAVRTNRLAEPLGLTLPEGPDLCHFSRSVKTLVWAPENVRRR